MKVAFVCVENSCRSQIAEALAKKMFPEQGIEFVSAGTHPAEKVDDGAIEILKEHQIEWKGHPKSFVEIGKPDILITMGCDVECPVIPDVKTVAWDISDPKGERPESYLDTLEIIKKHLVQFMESLKKKK